MKDSIFKYAATVFALGSIVCIILAFLGGIPWPTTFFVILLGGMFLGAFAEYRNLL